MKKLPLFFLLFNLLSTVLFAQKERVELEGYVFAEDNSGYLNNAKITLLTAEKTLIAETLSDKVGKFEFIIDKNQKYTLRVRQIGFLDEEITFDAAEKTTAGSVYLSVPMRRAAGYNFEATLSDWRPEDSDIPVYAITDATIEVYNKTERRLVLSLKNYPHHTFSFRMEHGNSYIILIQKVGYESKRIDANISIDGCILCIEGVGITRPGVADNLSDNNTTGTLGANIDLKIADEEALPTEIKSLESIIEAELFEEDVQNLMFEEVVQITEDGQPLAQNETASKKEKNTAPKQVYRIKNDPFADHTVNESIGQTATLARTHRITTDYTGYKIELLLSDKPLPAEHRLFHEMGGIELDVTPDNRYAYLIGNFSTENAAAHFLNNVILGRYPEAHLQAYKNGKRQNP